MRRAIFLDRDGVINHMVYHADFGLVDSPANVDQFELMPGVPEAIRAINDMGLLAIVVSNQPGVAKGKFSLTLLAAMTRKMHLSLASAGARLDGVYFCLHHPEAHVELYRVACDCRKPRPGLLLKAKRERDIDLSGSYLVGDGITDVLAGQVVGVKTFFVSSRKCYVYDELSARGAWPHCMVSDLSEAVRVIQTIESGATPDMTHYVPPTRVSPAPHTTRTHSAREEIDHELHRPVSC